MQKHNPIQTNFTAGELSPKMQGRVDIARYSNAVQKLQNWQINPQGGISRRTGTRFVKEVKDSSKFTRLVEFEFSTTQAYILEFGHNYIRVYKDEGAVLSGPTHVEITTTYAEADIPTLYFTQSADTLYICHKSYPPQKLTRSSHTSWTLSTIDFVDGPYLDENTTAVTFTASAATGSTTLTASSATFASTDVGRHVRIRNSGTLGWAKITAYTSSTVVTISVQQTVPTAAVTTWRLGAWSATTGYPACVAFFESRLCFAGSTSKPQTVWMSKSSEYETFSPTDFTAAVLDDSGIAYTIASNKVNAIFWLESSTVLLIGTSGAEWQLKAASSSDPVTPSNVQITQQTAYGSKQIRPKRVGSAVIYVQRSGRVLREMLYEFQIDGFVARDISLLSEHMMREGGYATAMAFQLDPWNCLWIVCNDGTLIGVTYIRDQEIVGWSRHLIGGSFGSSHAVVESVAVIPNPDGTGDQLWMVVKRTINGSTKRYIEFLEEPFEPTSPTDKDGMFFVDSGLTYDSTPATVISGLDHLEGQVVKVVADGSQRPDCTVTGGQITLTTEASVVHVGLGNTAIVTTLPPEGGSMFGSAQGKIKRTDRLGIRVLNSLTLKYGKDEDNLTELPFRKTGDPMDASPPLFTGDKTVNMIQSYESEGDVTVVQDKPYPLTILALMPRLTNYE